MSLLDHPDAQTLLKDAILTPEAVRGCRDRLRRFLSRYLRRFYRREQRDHADLVIRGLISGLQRKTAEPIADRAGVEHKNIQFFVGAGQWDDDAILMELWRHVRRVRGESEAVLVLDPSAFPKKGTESCGVARSGADDWARSRIVKSASSLPTPPDEAPTWSIADSICRGNGPRTSSGAPRATFPRPSFFKRNGRSLWSSGNGADRGCPIGGSSATMNWADRRNFGQICVRVVSGTSWTSRATPRSAIWSDVGPHVGEPASVESVRPPSFVPMNGRPAERIPLGPPGGAPWRERTPGSRGDECPGQGQA